MIEVTLELRPSEKLKLVNCEISKSKPLHLEQPILIFGDSLSIFKLYNLFTSLFLYLSYIVDSLPTIFYYSIFRNRIQNFYTLNIRILMCFCLRN